jgi:hypothetical protein
MTIEATETSRASGRKTVKGTITSSFPVPLNVMYE